MARARYLRRERGENSNEASPPRRAGERGRAPRGATSRAPRGHRLACRGVAPLVLAPRRLASPRSASPCSASPCVSSPCVVLPCVASPCNASPRVALHRVALHRIALHRVALHRVALHRIALHRPASHHIAPPCLASPCITSPCVAMPCIALDRSSWLSVTSRRSASQRVAPHRIVRRCIASPFLALHHPLSYLLASPLSAARCPRAGGVAGVQLAPPCLPCTQPALLTSLLGAFPISVAYPGFAGQTNLLPARPAGRSDPPAPCWGPPAPVFCISRARCPSPLQITYPPPPRTPSPGMLGSCEPLRTPCLSPFFLIIGLITGSSSVEG